MHERIFTQASLLPHVHEHATTSVELQVRVRRLCGRCIGHSLKVANACSADLTVPEQIFRNKSARVGKSRCGNRCTDVKGAGGKQLGCQLCQSNCAETGVQEQVLVRRCAAAGV